MNFMKKLGYLVLILLILSACDGKSSFVQKQSVGSINKVMVVIKSSDWMGEVGDSLRSSFGKIVVGLPQPEPTITLSQVAPSGFGNMMKSSRSIIIIEESEKEQFSIKYNVYANPQTVVYLSAKEDADLIRIFKQHEKEILAAFRQADITTTQKIFSKSKMDVSTFKTLQNLGLSFTIHNQYRTVEDTGEFLWLRHHLKSGIAQTGSNNILVYKKYPCLKGNLVGTDVSSTTNVPLGFKTLKISFNPTSKCSKLRTPNATVIASKLLSSKGRFSESPTTISMALFSFFALIFFRPTSNIPSLISKPIIFFAEL